MYISRLTRLHTPGRWEKTIAPTVYEAHASSCHRRGLTLAAGTLLTGMRPAGGKPDVTRQGCRVPRPAGSVFCRSGVLWLASDRVAGRIAMEVMLVRVYRIFPATFEATELCLSLCGSTEKDGRPLRCMKDPGPTGKDGRPLRYMKARESSCHRRGLTLAAGTLLTGMRPAGVTPAVRRQGCRVPRPAGSVFCRSGVLWQASDRVAGGIAMEVMLVRVHRMYPAAYEKPLIFAGAAAGRPKKMVDPYGI